MVPASTSESRCAIRGTSGAQGRTQEVHKGEAVKTFLLSLKVFLGALLICVVLSSAVWWKVYKYRDCLHVGHTKLYCISRQRALNVVAT